MSVTCKRGTVLNVTTAQRLTMPRPRANTRGFVGPSDSQNPSRGIRLERHDCRRMRVKLLLARARSSMRAVSELDPKRKGRSGSRRCCRLVFCIQLSGGRPVS